MDAQTWPKMTMMQEKKKDVQLQAMWFAAGTAAAMACLQRAILMSFMEQWRMLVFLALNLLLLAILFTSTHNNPVNSISSADGSGSGCNSSSSVEVDVDEEKKWKKQTGLSSLSADPPTAADEHKEHMSSTDHRSDSDSDSELLKCKTSKIENVAHIIKDTEDHHHLKNEEDEAHGQDQELSMEELNRRAEAFIAMFRQHLLSDAKVGNSCRLHPYSSHAK